MSAADTPRQAILDALRSVTEPRSGRDVVSAGYLREIDSATDVVRVMFELPAPLNSPESQELLRAQTLAALQVVEGLQRVDVSFKSEAQQAPQLLPGVKHVVAIGAGKGGVGKSTVAVLAAVGLQRLGLKVGLLDADVYGPSLPKLTGTEGAQPGFNDLGRVEPPEFAGIKIISMGYLVPANEAVIWRGPMAQKYVQEFLERGEWGELDYLIIDLPPGTGDIPLTLAQCIPLSGAVIVCTPQEVALQDAVKALRMYEKLGVDSLGVIENMSHYVCPHCGQREHIFGADGARLMAERAGVPFLGAIPLNIAIRQFGDAGQPLASFTEADPAVVTALEEVVRRLHHEVEARSRQRVPLPQVKVSE
jgi:ATP-binding protein involved in chromosome partitioning